MRIFLFLGVPAFILLWWWLSQPYVHRDIPAERFESFLKKLFHGGEPGSFFIAQHDDSPKFIQVALDSVRGDTISFETGVPDTTWSSDFFDALSSRASDAGFRTITDQVEAEGEVKRFLRVLAGATLEDSVSEGVRLLDLVREEMNLGEDETFTVRFGGNLSGRRYWQALDQELDEGGSRYFPSWYRRFVERRANRP